MIFKFNKFLLEKLSYSDDVEVITDYIINYLEEKEEWDDEEIIKIDNPYIKEVRIHFIENLKVPSFSSIKSDFNKGMIYIQLNPERVIKGVIHHEVFHGFNWIKIGGSDSTKPFEWAIINLDDFFEEDDILSDIVHLFYLISDDEIKSNFNQDVFQFKKYSSKNKLTKEDIHSLIEETEIFNSYLYAKNFNLNKELKKLNIEKMNEFISAVNQMENLNPGEEEDFVLKEFSSIEREKFIKKLNSIYNKQLKKVIEYLGKLKTHFYSNI